MALDFRVLKGLEPKKRPSPFPPRPTLCWVSDVKNESRLVSSKPTPLSVIVNPLTSPAMSRPSRTASRPTTISMLGETDAEPASSIACNEFTTASNIGSMAFDRGSGVFFILPGRSTFMAVARTFFSRRRRVYQAYGPRNLSPLKWIRCEGASAHHTSVSQAISPR